LPRARALVFLTRVGSLHAHACMFFLPRGTMLTLSAWPLLLQRKHPSALGKFEQIASASKGKKVVMFLDYDGTLSPIVADPDAAYMSDAVRLLVLLDRPRSPAHTTFHAVRPGKSSSHSTDVPPSPHLAQMRAAVRDVAKHFPTSIVSGRCRDKVHCLRHYSSQQPVVSTAEAQTLEKSSHARAACAHIHTHHWLIWLSSSLSRARARCSGAQLRRPLGALLRRQPWHGHQGTKLQCAVSSSPHFHLLLESSSELDYRSFSSLCTPCMMTLADQSNLPLSFLPLQPESVLCQPASEFLPVMDEVRC
jgi:hypothetical protein